MEGIECKSGRKERRRMNEMGKKRNSPEQNLAWPREKQGRFGKKGRRKERI